MYINITDSETGNNKGSSGALVHYLDKENRLFKDFEPELWFNGSGEEIESFQVRNLLDKNIAKLCHDDAKFFLINISPSQKEIAHLKSLYNDGAKAEFKAFAVKIMDEYARNFKRAGVQGNGDLLWFGKLENHRYYSFKDKEVKNGTIKRGDPKPGEQMHIQVIVSRKDITNKIKLSPMNNSKGRNVEHSKKVGQFDRTAFKESGERVFDETFDFKRPLTDTFRYANTQANGSLAERIALACGNDKNGKAGHGAEKNAERERTEMKDFFKREDVGILDLLLEKADFDPLNPALKKKKRRKGKTQSQELSI
ncbi:DUF5712 family protein [Pedobacter rhizosphaerae]|uniref:Molybdopterin-guanine dinucleotide biosynthesis protein MobB n=1 Tax=Pedobacter rhizosphaerae TaxID=390241 RepID=A0A1H9VP09_9SPHI|nr:DUF5712 family protein [Pedobacter rhizosphaerae]SES23308.1 hypothetical protein SAMN04488023_1467 [Pedobacter rhizosphaerae]